MRSAKTVFVVGAGASKEVGLPVGKELIEVIAEKLNYEIRHGTLVSDFGDLDIVDLIQQFSRDRPTLNDYLAAARRIREGVVFSNSIDTFLDAHKDDAKIQQLGKLGIAKVILEREYSSAMFIDTHGSDFQDAGMLKNSWFVRLVRGLTDGVRREEISRLFERVSFITFNYDRCIEHFLYNALRKHYGISDAETGSLMNTLTILHPYGTIAPLPWQERSGIPYGFGSNRPNLLATASRIRTYTEQLEDRTILDEIKNEIVDAETLVFLGFSYHDLNMKILDPERPTEIRNVFGTAFEISDSDVELIKDNVRRLVRRDLTENRMRGGVETITERLHIRSELKCGPLLEEYSRSLFAAGRRGSN